MGKYINTRYSETVNDISKVASTLLNTKFYPFSNDKPNLVEYYHINNLNSTMDEAARQPMQYIGSDSPFRYNLIHDFVVLGLDQITVSLQNDTDEGLQGDDISGEAIVLPNTIRPTPGDFFKIKILDKNRLFMVNDVQIDTLENQFNAWKITYHLEKNSDEEINKQVVNDYKFIVNNVNSQFKSVILSNQYDLITSLEKVTTQLRIFYKELYYRDSVQTFILRHYLTDDFYDPFLIEFLIRNKVMQDDESYLYVDHKLTLPATFAIDYARTFWRAVEDRNKKELQRSKTETTADYIDEFGSIFANRAEPYFRMNYRVDTYESVAIPYCIHNVITMFPPYLIDKCMSGTLYDDAEVEDNKLRALFNIIIKYFNNIDLEGKDIFRIDDIDYSHNLELFYMIPIVIYCIDNFMEGLMKDTIHQKPITATY